ncbi:MAG: hypothetical protein K2Q32_01750, partial [Alphaproteobacteria bacterium]|nr:hypothetical protein [Alphaproteobacteria bacterium]
KIMADLAIAVSQSFSKGIHSVTPGALFIAQLSKDVLMAMNARETGPNGQTFISELLNQHPALDLSKELPPEFQARIKDYIVHINYSPALDYIRGELPVSVNPDLLNHAVQQHLRHILPQDHEKRTVFKALSASAYVELRTVLLTELDGVAVENIKRVATGALQHYLRDKRFYNEQGQQIQADVPQMIKAFVDEHVGQNVLRVDNSAKPFRPEAEAFVDKLEAEGRLRVRREDAVVALLAAGKSQMGLNVKAMKYCEFPSELFPHKWPEMMDARTELEQKFIDAMMAADNAAQKASGGKEHVLTFDDLMSVNMTAANAMKTEYAINDRMKNSKTWKDAPTRDLYGIRDHLARDAATYAARMAERSKMTAEAK